MIKPGDVFQITRPGYLNPKPHFFYVLFVKDDKVLLVNTTSFKGTSHEDTSCVINPADYDLISKMSIINYGQALETSIEDLEKAKALYWSNPISFRECPPIGEDLLNRMIAGAKRSNSLPNKYKRKYCMDI